MPRRKEPTYNDYARQIESLQAKMAERRERMVQILSSVLDDKAAAALGDLSDRELKKVMELIVEDISVYVDKVIVNRRPRSAPKAKTDPIPESVPKSAEKPAQTVAKAPEATAQARPLLNGVMKFNEDRGAWGIWDNDVKGWYLSVVKQGTQLEVDDYGQWVKTSFEIEREKPARDAGYFPLGIWNNMTTRNLCYEGLRVRSVQSAQ